MSTIRTFSIMFVPNQAGSIQRVTDNQKILFNKLWIYPAASVAKDNDASGLAQGLLVPNQNNIHVGEDMDGHQATPDTLAAGDPPIGIELPQGQTKRLFDVLVQSEIQGDGVFIKGWV